MLIKFSNISPLQPFRTQKS